VRRADHVLRRAIGYGKCAMVFHMLDQMMGEDKFFETLRGMVSKYLFKQMGWAEIEDEFSKAKGEDLDWFFSQWVRGTGAPLLKITKAAARDEWTEYVLSIKLEQEGGPFRLSVPIAVRTEDGRLWRTIEMNGAVAEARIKCRAKPIMVEVDPGHDVMRRMASVEIAPTLSQVLGDDQAIVVKPGRASPEATAAYGSLAAQLTRTGEARIIPDSELTQSEIAAHCMFILGGAGDNSAIEMFRGEWPMKVFARPGKFTIGGNSYSSAEDCALFVGRNPLNPDKTIAILAGLSGPAVEACSRKVIHYGKYGYVVFKSGQAVDKGTWEIRDYPWMRVSVARGW
jgi:aminopeptidase N